MRATGERDRHDHALGRRARRRVGEEERAAAVLVGRRRRGPAADQRDEVGQLVRVGARVAVEEEVLVRRLGLHRGGGGEADQARRGVRDLEHAPPAERLQTLVVAGRAVPGVDDRDDGAGGGAQRDHRRVVVAGGPRAVVEEHRAGRVHLDDVGEEEAGHVEVVDRHVAEDPARDGDVGGRRRRGVATDDRELLQRADLARGDPRAHLSEGRVEAPVEAERHRHAARGDRLAQRVHLRDVEIDRLLAQHRQPQGHRPRDEVDMGRGRRGDEHRVQIARLQQLLGGVGGDAAVRRDGLARAVHERIGHPGEHGLRARGDVGGVQAADAAGADEAEAEGRGHVSVSFVVS